MNERKQTPVLEEEWRVAETIDSKGNYQKLRYRMIEQIAFYIRPMQEWFIPCAECQKKLKEQMAKARWILGNKTYEPAIELNNTKNEYDEDSVETIEERKATPAEIKRIGLDGWEEIE